MLVMLAKNYDKMGTLEYSVRLDGKNAVLCFKCNILPKDVRENLPNSELMEISNEGDGILVRASYPISKPAQKIISTLNIRPKPKLDATSRRVYDFLKSKGASAKSRINMQGKINFYILDDALETLTEHGLIALEGGKYKISL